MDGGAAIALVALKETLGGANNINSRTCHVRPPDIFGSLDENPDR